MNAAVKSPIPTRQLGSRTGVMVTELGLGTAPLGETFDVIEEDEARALLSAAWDGGVRYFDTSPWYGKGQAARRLDLLLIHDLDPNLWAELKDEQLLRPDALAPQR